VPLRSHGRHSNGHAHWTFSGSLALGRQQHGRPPRQSQPPAMPRNESDAKGAALASRSVDPGGHFFAGQCLVSDAWRARASYHLREVGLLGISSTLSACRSEGPTKAVRYRFSASLPRTSKADATRPSGEIWRPNGVILPKRGGALRLQHACWSKGTNYSSATGPTPASSAGDWLRGAWPKIASFPIRLNGLVRRNALRFVCLAMT
jgi:hypothetical protein